MSYGTASIVPLIGGMTIAQMRVFDEEPVALLSYSPFSSNETHLTGYLKDLGMTVPRFELDKEKANIFPKIDIVNSTCPCAGLSTLSTGYGDANPNNDWMRRTADYVLSEIRPTVLWGENAPGLAGKIGATVRRDLREIGRKNGYSFMLYLTKSLLHGIPQVRHRTFYFFWKGDSLPIFGYVRKPRDRIEDVIRNAKGLQTEPTNPKIPSRDDPYYRYVLEEVHGGVDHAKFREVADPKHVTNSDMHSYIERNGHSYSRVGNWMAENGFDREVPKCARKERKLADGMSFMRRATQIPFDYIGAFVGHLPTSLTHPDEDRYINYREAMTIMGLPSDFELLNPGKTLNHICQNVPVGTATDMAEMVKQALDGNIGFTRADYGLVNNVSMKTDFESPNPTSLYTFG